MTEIQEKIIKYIKDNFAKTIKTEVSKNSLIKLKKPYTTPCMDKDFIDFYYWDTYFTDFIPAYLGTYGQIENNLDNFCDLIDKFGFIPNADHLTNRSQPPLFASAVYDYYKLKNDVSVIKKYINHVETEYSFWMKNRISDCGLNVYGDNATDKELKEFFVAISPRVGNCGNDDENNTKSKNYMAIAESGWDFTSRFDFCDEKFAVTQFCPVDLNSILFGTEKILSQFYGALGNSQKRDIYSEKAETRRKTMIKIMRGNDGVLYDYNFKMGKINPVRTCASFLPYAFKVDENATACKLLYDELSLKHGVSACEKGNGKKTLQWDYPFMWAPLVYFAYTGLKNCNLSGVAEELKNKYLYTVEKVFIKTGKLFEKYDALTGDTGVSAEYDTPEMLGWTAGVYLLLIDNSSRG